MANEPKPIASKKKSELDKFRLYYEFVIDPVANPRIK